MVDDLTDEEHNGEWSALAWDTYEKRLLGSLACLSAATISARARRVLQKTLDEAKIEETSGVS